MSPQEHLKQVVNKTECAYLMPATRFNPEIARLFHGFILIQGEGAEGIDALKKHIYYGKELDEANLLEEVGDALYGCQVVCECLGITIEQALEANKRKLMQRYPEGFSEEKAIHRNTQKELEVMK